MFKRYWWMLLVMIPVGAMVGFLIASVVTYVMPKKYESSATIEVKPRERTVVPLGDSPSSGASSQSSQFLATEFNKIKSRKSLMKVVDALDLSNRWGMDRDSVVQVLKAIVSTENIVGTDLISIRVRHTNKEDARDIAAEVARAYKEYRTELANETVEKAMNVLKKAVIEQEDKVEERRKVLETIRRSKDIIYRGDNNEEEKPKTEDAIDRADYQDAKTDFETEQSLLEQLKLKLISSEFEYDITADTVIVHDDPVIADAPVSPNVTLNLVFGLAIGGLLSPFLALPLMWMMNRGSAVS